MATKPEPQENNISLVIAAGGLALLMTIMTAIVLSMAVIGISQNQQVFTADIENPLTDGYFDLVIGFGLLCIALLTYRMTYVSWKERHMPVDTW